LKRENQEEKKNLKQLFSWSPSLDTGMAALTQIVIMILAFLGLKAFGNTIFNPILFGLMGTLIVGVIFPLYWMIVKREKGIYTLGITGKRWPISLLAGFLLGAFVFFGYYRSFGLDAAIIPALIIGLYSIWEVLFVYGWLQTRFEKAFGIIPAVFLAGLCFALYHLFYGWYDISGFIQLFVVGIVMGIIFRTTKNILILWPFLWPIACLRGFKMGGFVPGWKEAGSSAILFVLMLVSIFIFYRIQLKRNCS
jgi:membrane protease YdiL (CAAX protease family)